MFCLNCHYDLRGNASKTCPECGHAFDPQDPSSYVTHAWSPHWLHRAVGATLLVLVIVWAVTSTGSVFEMFFDLSSLIWVAAVLVGGLWFSFGPGTVCRAVVATIGPRRPLDRDRARLYLRVWAAAYQLSWAAGLVGVTLSLIAMLAYLSDPWSIGGGMALALLTVLYGSVLAELVIVPMWRILANRVPQTGDPESLLLAPNRSLLGLGFALVFLLMLMMTIALLMVLP